MAKDKDTVSSLLYKKNYKLNKEVNPCKETGKHHCRCSDISTSPKNSNFDHLLMNMSSSIL